MPGPGDPPKEHRFSSENQPKNRGRKKGSKNFKTIYKKFLELKLKPSELDFEVPFVDRDTELTAQEILVLRHLKKSMMMALTKDIDLVINRTDGPVKQEQDINLKSDVQIYLPNNNRGDQTRGDSEDQEEENKNNE